MEALANGCVFIQPKFDSPHTTRNKVCLFVGLHVSLLCCIFCKKKTPLHVGMEVKKAWKQGRDYDTKKTNLIQEEYPTSVPHT